MREFRFGFSGAGRKGWSVGKVLIAANILWYVVIETIFGHTTLGLVRSGAMVNAFVTHGQLFRLVSSMFVHVSIAHIVVNMISLWTLTVVEQLVGSYAFLTIYIVSGIVGNLFGLSFEGALTVSAGASGAIFGLFGVMLALAFMRKLPPIVRNQLLIMLAINVVLDATNHSIDWLAHLGGLLTGMILTIWLVMRPYRLTYWKAFAYASGVVTVVALLVALFTPIPISS